MAVVNYVIRNIFEPFYTTKGVGEGAGLGLPMVIGTVKSHCGAVEVESRPGQGSIFTTYCPLCETEDAEQGQTSLEVNGSGETTLLDDDAVIIDTVRKILVKFGYKVVTAADGRKALDLYREQQTEIDLVMLIKVKRWCFISHTVSIS